MAKRLGREYWERLISEFERSGMEHAAFAASKGVSKWTFQGWLYRLRDERGERQPEVRMLPVKVAASPQASGVVEIAVAGVVVRLHPGADVAAAARLVAALEARPC